MNNYISVAILLLVGVVIFALLIVGDSSLFNVEADTASRALEYVSSKV